MEKSTLIVMHGVGDSPPGASLLEVSQGLHAEGVAGLADDLVIDGIRFPRMRLDHPRFAEIIEVNWSDVARPTRNMFAIVGFVARIVLALLDVATTIARERRLWLPQVYIASLEALLVYCIYPPLVTMLWMTTQAGWQSTLAIGAGGVLVTAGLTFYLRRFQLALRAGWLWAVAIALTTGAVALGPLPVEAAVRMATYLYLFSQAATGVLLLIALVGLAVRRSWPLDHRIAGMALLYFPFFILSAIGAVLWAVTLYAVGRLADAQLFENWQMLYSRILESWNYNLALIEFTFASMIGGIAVGALIVAFVYRLRAERPPAPSGTAGEFARKGARYVLGAGALTFVVLCVVYATANRMWTAPNWTNEALEVYSLSSLRIVPYLPFTIGPLAVVTGTVVDVLFYMVSSHELSTADNLRCRLSRVIEYARSRTGAPVVVAAHSQGSVVAVDVIGRARANNAPTATCLITAGSPVDALYQRFLGSSPEDRAAAEDLAFAAPVHWINFSREGDYIGAGQRRPGVKEINLGRGGHTGYWRSKKLWNDTLSELDALVPRPDTPVV